MTINSIKKNCVQNLHGYQLNPIQFFRIQKILELVKTQMHKKSVVLAKSTYTENKNVNFLTMDLLYNNSKLLFYNKKRRSIYARTNNSNPSTNRFKMMSRKRKAYLKRNPSINRTQNSFNKRLTRFSQKRYSITKSFVNRFTTNNNPLDLKIVLINKKENRSNGKLVSDMFKKYKYLFSRRNNLYIDCIRMTSLFCEKNIDVNVFTLYLAYIFSFLVKRSHARYLMFIKNILNILILLPKSQIKGLKFEIRGKLKGKPRSSKFACSVGQIGLQTISTDTAHSFIPVKTMYGTFGINFWVNYTKETLES